jgi:hypothetical protein
MRFLKSVAAALAIVAVATTGVRADEEVTITVAASDLVVDCTEKTLPNSNIKYVACLHPHNTPNANAHTHQAQTMENFVVVSFGPNSQEWYTKTGVNPKHFEKLYITKNGALLGANPSDATYNFYGYHFKPLPTDPACTLPPIDYHDCFGTPPGKTGTVYDKGDLLGSFWRLSNGDISFANTNDNDPINSPLTQTTPQKADYTGAVQWHWNTITNFPAPGPDPFDNDPLTEDKPYEWLQVEIPESHFAAIGFGYGLSDKFAGGRGDPQFNGLQGQSYQFHGMADEVFSLVSSPELQMNSLFKFISSGSCTYNNTVCWSHPGTYLGQIGIQFGNEKILLQSGSHSDGMQVFLNDKPMTPSKHVHRIRSANNSTGIAQFEETGIFELYTDLMYIRIVNSDYFFNLDFGLKDRQVLTAGAKVLAINGEVCEREATMPKSQLTTSKALITKKLKETYPSFPLHGLVGQTWRNAVYCGRYYEGTVDDYVTGGLFANEHTFNFFKL